MQKADFENNVQQKMQELRFQPSQEVWKQVEAGIATERRRRPIVLWSLFAGLLLAGGSFYFLNSGSQKDIVADKPQQSGQAIAEKRDAVSKSQDRSTYPTNENHSSNTEAKTPQLSAPQLTAAPTAPAGSSKTYQQGASPLKPAKRSKQTSSKQRNKPGEFFNSDYNIDGQVLLLRNGIPIDQYERASMRKIAVSDFPSREISEQQQPLAPLYTMDSKLSAPVKKTRWQFGIYASGGVSDLGEQLLQTAASANFAFDPLQANGGPAVASKPSAVEKSASFSVGVFANKTLGRKWKVGLGLGYQYFSNKIEVGEKVDSAALVNQNNFSMDRVSQYYKSTGNNPYQNQYHFITIPVSLQWQFAKRFTWENGLVASRMISTNALHYDGVSGRYYEYDDLFNKYQFSASTALLFSFYMNKIQVGPQLQYAFTNLMKPNTGNPKHLRAVAIKANVELWKK